MNNLQIKTSTVKWFKAAGIRALRTFAQATLSAIGSTAVGITEINWMGALSIGAAAAAVSLLTSVATNLPEIQE